MLLDHSPVNHACNRIFSIFAYFNSCACICLGLSHIFGSDVYVAVIHIICFGSIADVNRTSVRSDWCVLGVCVHTEEHTQCLALMTVLSDSLVRLINETSSNWFTCVNNSYFPEYRSDYILDQPSSVFIMFTQTSLNHG